MIPKEFRQSQKQLYLYFNNKGAILADFDNYSPSERENRLKALSIGFKSDSVEVNPNYLKINPVYDVNGEKINIDESCSDYVLLVPEKYKPFETEIREYYQFIKNGRRLNKDSIVVNQSIKIIWTKNGQKLFSYRIDINPAEGNKVKDPVIRVITEANGDITDYDRIIAYSGNPFKIKVDDASNPSASIRPQLEQCGLSGYIPSVSSVFDNVEAEVRDTVETLMVYLLFIFLLGGLIIIIIFQNIYNYFEQHSMRMAVQKFHGYKRKDRYNTYFKMVIVSWLIIATLLVMAYRKNMLQVLVLSIVCMVFEIALSLSAFAFVERRKTVEVIKGG